MRNTAYTWSHMLNNVASAIFGFIYIALWQAVAPVTSSQDPYTRATMTGMMVLAQVFAWVTVFLPAGLGIQNSVRTGSIALEMARPVPFFPMVLAREAGTLAYQALFRCIPIGILFALTVGFPKPASFGHAVLTIPSLILGSYISLCLVYMVGISSLWTTEIRWAHWTYHSVILLLSGGWVPAELLPGWLGRVALYLPFASQVGHSVRIYLGFSGAESLVIQGLWAMLMTLLCNWVTRRALHRVVVQGG